VKFAAPLDVTANNLLLRISPPQDIAYGMTSGQPSTHQCWCRRTRDTCSPQEVTIDTDQARRYCLKRMFTDARLIVIHWVSSLISITYAI
jgi:hypothetical protein